MNILVVDDERMPLEYLMRMVNQVIPDANAAGFIKPSEALEYAGKNHIDLAFLDIEVGGMNGLQLAGLLKDIHGDIRIVFTTGYSEYEADVYAEHASGFLTKPISADAISEVMTGISPE